MLRFPAYLRCSDKNTEDVVNKYILGLQTLSYSSKIDINGEAPQGCAIITVSDKCEVHLLLKGLIEPSKEITKLQKKIDFLQGTQKKLNQMINAADYSSKVPVEVQQSNAEKLAQTLIEIERIESAIAALQKMAI